MQRIGNKGRERGRERGREKGRSHDNTKRLAGVHVH